MDYICYYQQYEDYVCYHSNTKEITIINKLPDNPPRHYEMLNEYDPTHEELIRFSNDFAKWIKKMKTRKYFSIDYLKYYNHHIATVRQFKILCKGLYENIEDVDIIEYMWINRCHNGGLLYCKEGNYIKCFGYDFKNNHPMRLTEFRFPTKKGKEEKITELKKHLRFGYYHVKIESDDSDIKKVFAFSKHHVYTNTSIEQARRLQDRGFSIDITLVIDDEPNCYVYKTKDVIVGDKVFGKWYKQMTLMRKDLPDIKLLKFMLSSLWGHLCESNVQSYNTEYIEKHNLWDELCVGNESKYKIIEHCTRGDDNDYYRLLDNENPAKYPLYRIKAFLNAYHRNRTAQVALEDIDHVVRICIDNVTFNKEQKNITDKYNNLFLEEKSTGHVIFIHSAKYYNKTTKHWAGHWTDEDKQKYI